MPSANLAWHPAEVAQAGDEPLERRGARRIRGEAQCRRPAVAEDGHHDLQLDELHRPVAARSRQRPQVRVRPVGLELRAGICLEADDRLFRARWTQRAQVANERWVTGAVAVVAAELVVEHRAADARAHRQPPRDVRQLRVAQPGSAGSHRVAPWRVARQLALDRAPVQPELARQRRDRPPVLVQDS